MNTNNKEILSPEELYVLLDREFRRRRPRGCDVCHVQLPYRIDARQPGEANWEVLIPPECGVGCDVLMDEIVADLRTRYQLTPAGS